MVNADFSDEDKLWYNFCKSSLPPKVPLLISLYAFVKRSGGASGAKFNDDVMWVVNGCNHTDSGNTKYWNYMVPRWNDSTYRGVNTISSPSVLSFRRDTNIRFDDNLVMLMDCEIYHNFYTNYGLPVIVTETLVTNRLHDNQISTNYKLNINDEINYVKKKYNIL